MKVKLTPGFVLKAAPPAKGDRIIYWDEALPCFGLMITKNGHRSFVVQYRANCVSRRLTFKDESRGGLSLDKARREAKSVIGSVTTGGDPLSDRRKAAARQQTPSRALPMNSWRGTGRGSARTIR
jgi:hypothetical protein